MYRHERNKRHGNRLKLNVRAWSLAVLLAAGSLVSGTSCLDRSNDDQDCSLAALRVIVVDGESGTGVPNATVTATVAETVITLEKAYNWERFLPLDSVYAGGDRVGQYTVHVEAPGYEAATTEAIQVPEGQLLDGRYLHGCSYAPVYWRVALTRLPE